ncbi:MAG: hypothetical protein DRP11_02535 [Candidatus Aenigmatarchaeota archaeon]|nr:MAG: hypothetical protein DRP11_02535 [Candidatus Aenigmarchaeota archaeon]
MKRIGTLDMKLEKVEEGILYYRTDISISGRKTSALLPRYHPFLGWIEMFGFPPQHRWLVLKSMKPFERSAKLVVNGEKFDEAIRFNTSPLTREHLISVHRENRDMFEDFHFYENYSNVPEEVIARGYFSHSDGIYTYLSRESGFDSERLNLQEPPLDLIEAQEHFIETMIGKYGEPDSIWLKEFSASGVKPPLYYRIFPADDLFEVEAANGWILELGYLNKEGDEIDRIHGEWHKLMSVNQKLFYVKEGGWKSKNVEINGENVRVKDRYNKELFIYK